MWPLIGLPSISGNVTKHVTGARSELYANPVVVNRKVFVVTSNDSITTNTPEPSATSKTGPPPMCTRSNVDGVPSGPVQS